MWLVRDQFFNVLTHTSLVSFPLALIGRFCVGFLFLPVQTFAGRALDDANLIM